MLPISEQNKKFLIDKVNNLTYLKGKMLGSGGFAKCYEAICQEDGKIYAAKVIPKKSINQKRQRYKLLIEIKIHSSLSHQNIVGFKSAFEDKENVYILLEYCLNYTLKQLVKRRKRVTEHEARVYISQIVKALLYIHSRGIIHRDLKLGNILISEHMEAKICDFGLSTRVKKQGDTKKTICGTPNYIAPQILEENGHSYEVDIWSIGVILYTLLVGKPPFEDNTVQQTYQNIKNNRFAFPPQILISSSVKDLISKILVMDPLKRLTLNQILQHQFMNTPNGLSSLPRSTLAVPPLHFHLDTIQHSNLLHSEVSQQLELNQSKNTIQPNSNMPFKIPEIYIRQIFQFQDNFGYLLSNGIIGCYLKQIQENYVLEFGSEKYIRIKPNYQVSLHTVPFEEDYQPNLRVLMNFKAFFVTKYSLLKLDQIYKRAISGEYMYLKRCFKLNQREILTRLSNEIIQLHFNDLTSIMINHDHSDAIYFANSKGKQSQIIYKECKDSKVKTKTRRFSHLLQILSEKSQHQLQDSQIKR